MILKHSIIFLFLIIWGNWANAQTEDTSTCYEQKELDIKAQFSGGEMELMKFIGMHIIYPVKAKENNIQGRVVVRFRVRSNGSLDKISVVNDTFGYGLSEAVIEVVKKMPKWVPGQKNGEHVNSWYSLPVKFQMNDASRKPTMKRRWWKFWK